ncbi:MAG: sulfur carrier protein ThiS [Acidobacteriota bacterium]
MLRNLEPMQDALGLQIVVNGNRRRVADGLTLAQWLAGLGRDPKTVAIERNGVIVRRADYGSTHLVEGDVLELVHFVQGG